MNFVFLSPNFPKTYFNFTDRLKKNGFNTLGIGDEPYSNLSVECRNSLTEYYKVSSLENYDEVYRAPILRLNTADSTGWNQIMSTGLFVMPI